MTRLLKLVTIIFTVISLTSAQFVDTLNTPLGPVTQGAKVAVSWSLLAGVDATGKNGDLSATDSATKNVIDIDPAVPLAPKTYLWNVQVPPGTYVLGLNDGSGLKQSGEVVVKAGNAPAPGGGAAAPPGGNAPAPAPPGGAAPAPAPAPPAGGAATSTSASTPTGGAGAGGAAGAGGSGAGGAAGAGGSGAGAAGGAGGSSTTPTGGSGSPASTPPSVSSASSIFSGYGIVLSLLGTAIAMVQF